MNNFLRIKNSSSGAVALITTLAISAIILMIATFGSIISAIALTSVHGERLTTNALLAARSGAQDSIIKIVRDKNCMVGGGSCYCPVDTPCSIDFDNNTSAEVTITKNGEIITVSSVGEALNRRKKIEANLEVDSTTGKVRVQSFKEVPA